MDKTVKNVLAAVGAIAMVKAAPVLAVGVAIGTVVANPDKAKKAVEDFVGRVEEEVSKYAEEYGCECCAGGECHCECECECDSEEGTEEQEKASWEEEIPVEEAPAPEEPVPAEEDKMENLRAKAEDFLEALKALGK